MNYLKAMNDAIEVRRFKIAALALRAAAKMIGRRNA